jgi:hypothetical protein
VPRDLLERLLQARRGGEVVLSGHGGDPDRLTGMIDLEVGRGCHRVGRVKEKEQV